jgi:hypothetical protein
MSSMELINCIFYGASLKVLNGTALDEFSIEGIKMAIDLQLKYLSKILIERFNDENVVKKFDLKSKLLNEYDEKFKTYVNLWKNEYKINFKELESCDIDSLKKFLYNKLINEYRCNPNIPMIIYVYIESIIHFRLIEFYNDVSKIGISNCLNLFLGYRSDIISSMGIVSNYKGPFNDEEFNRMETIREFLLSTIKSPILLIDYDFIAPNSKCVQGLDIEESSYIEYDNKEFYNFKIIVNSNIYNDVAKRLIDTLHEINSYNGFRSKTASRNLQEYEFWLKDLIPNKLIMKNRINFVKMKNDTYNDLIKDFESRVQKCKFTEYDLFKGLTKSELKELGIEEKIQKEDDVYEYVYEYVLGEFQDGNGDDYEYVYEEYEIEITEEN